jgi:AcrR family transcriptional regulator
MTHVGGAGRSTTNSRKLLRNAAHELFLAKGYAAVSVRDIAARAGVDPTLIIRHFGSKERLFLETVSLSDAFSAFLDGPIETLGTRIVAYFRDLPPSGTAVESAFVALIRASDRSAVRTTLERAVGAVFVDPLVPRMSGAEVRLRARLISAQVTGLLIALYVVEDEELLAADRSAIVELYGAAIQLLVDGLPADG